MNIGLNKNTLKSIAIFVVSLIIYNIVFLVIPFKHTTTFKVAYAFGTIAIIAQVVVTFLALSGANTLRKKFYAYPISRMGVIYLAVQMVISLAFAIITTYNENFPNWIVFLVCALVLGVFTILILLTDTARDKIEKIEEEEERHTVQIKTFRINIDSIVRRVEDEKLLKKLNELSDIAKYSDPVSSEALFAVENEITEKIDELDLAIRNKDFENAEIIAEQTICLFEDRNAQCKAYKN